MSGLRGTAGMPWLGRDARFWPICDISTQFLLWCTAAFFRNGVVMCGLKPTRVRMRRREFITLLGILWERRFAWGKDARHARGGYPMAGVRYFEQSFFELFWQDVVDFNAELIEIPQGTLSANPKRVRFRERRWNLHCVPRGWCHLQQWWLTFRRGDRHPPPVEHRSGPNHRHDVDRGRGWVLGHQRPSGLSGRRNGVFPLRLRR